MTTTHHVVFTPSGLEGDVADGITVLAAAQLLGVDLDTVCGGRGVCGRCQVTPSVGTHAKWAVTVGSDALSPPGAVEAGYRGRRTLTDGRRLGCAAAVLGDVVIDVPPDSQVHRHVVRKDLDLGVVEVDPHFRLLFVDADGRLDGARLGRALNDQHGITTEPATMPCSMRSAPSTARSQWPSPVTRRGSLPCGPAWSTASTAWPSTSVRPPWLGTCASSAAARCWPVPDG
ncbi:MAG: hypothetical protein OES57_01530 [Acidimicrobiia bacterium]|nr:hypothetical protein [Acidimicrobiia bacterium]